MDARMHITCANWPVFVHAGVLVYAYADEHVPALTEVAVYASVSTYVHTHIYIYIYSGTCHI